MLVLPLSKSPWVFSLLLRLALPILSGISTHGNTSDMITSYTNQIHFLYKQYFPFSYKTKKKVLGADILFFCLKTETEDWQLKERDTESEPLNL
jgi:hypothetical protein